ncbi:F-box protein SNE-like [Nicotiana tabacum]|uniref:F-box protein SNE-like n=2 Tax=Nicotiana TaxID=4085 RepID=A0A1S3XK45_TOBAC|nr:PREDICTED: F-box protein SNE-like [Nicotiana sylvestris]XP_016440037.1 PREDICTED: F-box protein SNE-like [Nicotiana tabacum]
MVQLEEKGENEHKGTNFFINDNIDVLIEILQRLDGGTLGVAACVCRLWCSITRNDSLWEHLCFRHVSRPPDGVKTVVLALGGYRRLYMVCVRPVLDRLKKWKVGKESDSEVVRRVWTRHEVELSLSLFCVDYYERVFLGGGSSGGRLRGGGSGGAAAASSLMFLCNAVNV